MSDAHLVLERAGEWSDAGHRVAIATVVSTSGSSPRPAGSQLALREDRTMEGSVSGGCVEAAVIESCREVITTGVPKLMNFRASGDELWDAGLACGGDIEVLLEPLQRPFLAELQSAIGNKEPVVVVTELASGRKTLISADSAGADLAQPIAEAVSVALLTHRANTVEAPAGRYFIHPYPPRLRLILIGAVHIAQTLVPMAAACDYELTIVDPRSDFAKTERFPAATMMHQWPTEALAELNLDARCALVALSHDAKIDDPALLLALQSQCFYVGALGSRRTHQKRLLRLRDAGLDEEQLSRILGPVGLAIGALHPAEIAVSILAQLTECLRNPTT